MTGADRSVRRRFVCALAVSAMVLQACGAGSPAVRSTTVPQVGPTATVRFGFVGALTGPMGVLGADVADGEKLAISQFDAVDPPVRVAIDAVDTAGDPARARAAAARLVADRVVAVIGLTLGSEALAAQPVFEQGGIPTVTVSAADRDLAARGWRFFHRLIPDDALQGQAAGEFLVKNLHATDVAVVDDSTASSRDLAVSAAEAVTGAGGSVVSSEHLDGRPGDVASVVAAAVRDSADAVFFAGAAATAARLGTGLRDAGFAGKFLVDGTGAAGFVGAAGAPGAEGAYIACGCAGTDQNPDAQAFNAAYLAQFGSSPGPYAAEAYDATNAVLQAIKSGDTTPAAVNAFLSSVDYAGITRPVKFAPDGDWVGDAVYLYKVESGQAVQFASSAQA